MYTTGDRVGCGVLGDGSVFFTLNGVYFAAPPEDPKVTAGTWYSSIYIVGGDAHLQFYYDSFMFTPSEFNV